MSREVLPPSSLEAVEAVFLDPSTYRISEAIPLRGRTGRPRDYPAYMFIGFRDLISAFGSARQVEAELAHPEMWGFIRRLVRKRFPKDRSMWLPEKPMRRHHYRYAKEKFLTDPQIHAAIRDASRREAVDTAREIGVLDPGGPGSFTHPDLSRMLHGDATVIPPIYKARPGDTREDERTGETKLARYDPDAGFHMQGDGKEAWGTSHVLISVRSEDHRVVLDAGSVPRRGHGGEGGVVMDSLARIAPLAPGVQCIAYDSILRGVHLRLIMREFGWLGINRVPAAENRMRRKGQRRAPRKFKVRFLKEEDLPLVDGAIERVRLYARDGAVVIGRISETGDSVYEPLRRKRIQRRVNKDGTYRFNVQLHRPSRYLPGEINVPLIATEEDRRTGFNRAENLRAIPYSDPDFRRLYGRRNDAESINRKLADSLYLGRAHSVGHQGQDADLLGFAHLINCISRFRHRARERLRAAA